MAEYAGPVLPREWQQQSGYNLGIPSGNGGVGSPESPWFIDGDSSQAPFPWEQRSLGPYANHSSVAPNAAYVWRVAETRVPHALAGSLWIVATEPIPAGAEVRSAPG